MKKLFLAISLLIATSTLMKSQDSIKLMSKKGHVIQPVAGDWCIGISASPFLDYLGNFLKITQNNNTAPQFGFTAQNPGTITGKYQQTDTKAIRFGLTIGISTDVENEPSPLNSSETNSFTNSALALGISLGIEKYRPLKSRLLGFYGYEGAIALLPYSGKARNSNSFITGRLTYDDPNNSDNNFVEKGGNTINLSCRGFVGVEYFFAPKISLSGEFGLGINMYYKTERKYEPEDGTKEITEASKYGYNLSPNASGDLVLRLYF